jgi:protein YIPF5/7
MNFEEFKDVYYIDKINIRSALTGSLPEDPPLLSELGIDFSTIKKESHLIFKVLQRSTVDFSFIRNADLSGPVIFIILYTISLVINRKVHFGYIYFISLVTSLSTYFLLNVIDLKYIGLLECCSVLGYSLLPVVFFSFLNLLLSRTGLGIRVCCGLLFAGWSSYTASVVFCQYLSLTNKQMILGYPLLLAYVCFTMIVLF